jgi:hypothetical protein
MYRMLPRTRFGQIASRSPSSARSDHGVTTDQLAELAQAIEQAFTLERHQVAVAALGREIDGRRRAVGATRDLAQRAPGC